MPTLTTPLSCDCPAGTGGVTTELRQFALAVVLAGDVTEPGPALALTGAQAKLPALFIGTLAAVRTGYVNHQD